MDIRIRKTLSRAFIAALAIGTLLTLGVAAPQAAGAKGNKASKAARLGTAAANKCSGKVTAVDTSAGTITVHNKKAGDRTLSVTGATRVKVNKAKATLADVQVGMHATIKTLDQNTALAIHAHNPKNLKNKV